MKNTSDWLYIYTWSNSDQEAGQQHPVFHVNAREHFQRRVNAAGHREYRNREQQRQSHGLRPIAPQSEQRTEDHLAERIAGHHVAHELFAGVRV